MLRVDQGKVMGSELYYIFIICLYHRRRVLDITYFEQLRVDPYREAIYFYVYVQDGYLSVCMREYVNDRPHILSTLRLMRLYIAVDRSTPLAP